MTLLAVENLHVRIEERPILNGLNLGFEPGTLVGLIGPNGAGKTTLLRSMLGLVPVEQGRVLLDGAPLKGKPPRARARAMTPRARARAMAYLPQRPPVLWPIRVDDLIRLGRLPHLTPFAPARGEDHAAVARALNRTRLNALAARSVTGLSGGEQARALLARALAVESRILLADEPAASLDPYHQIEVWEILRAAARRGMCIIAVLHELTLAARFCHRIVLIHGGRIIGDGPPEAVLTDALLARAYRIETLRGHHEGHPFILPWRRLP